MKQNELQRAIEAECRVKIMDWLLKDKVGQTLTLSDFSRSIGISRPTIYKFLYGKGKLHLATLVKIRTFLEINHLTEVSSLD